MKRLIIIAALIIAAVFGAKAQTPTVPKTETDSVSVMLRHLANTNAEVVYLNESLRLHSQLTVSSFAAAGLSAFMFYIASTCDPPAYPGAPDSGKGFRITGISLGAASAVLFVCSYIPIWTSKVKVDNRGLIISLP